MLALLPALLLQLQAAAPPPDSVQAIRREATRAEREFERLARRLAPLDFGAAGGGECDEVVGRFCLRYDTGRPPEPAPEPDRVTTARRLAIEALRRAFSFQAAEFTTSGPLVRYLVEDGRAGEAVSAARTYAALTTDSVWGPLLLGFALHAAADDTAAERLFAEGLARLDADGREDILDVEWLLGPEDRKAYRGMEPVARRAFESDLWTLADPLFLVPGNARRAEHIFRHVYGRILARAPMASGMVRWGDDLQQLTVRYGVPYSRSRTAGSVTAEGSLIEHFDPDQLAYVPEDLLTRGPAPPPLPGETWPLGNPRTRSGHAPETIRTLSALPHQITVFPDGNAAVVRVDAALPFDSLASGGAHAEIGFWLLNDRYAVAAQRTGRASSNRDTAAFRLELGVLPGPYVYSVEALEPQTAQGGRARYALDIAPPGPGVTLSDPLLARPFASAPPPTDRDDPSLRALTDLALSRGDTVGLFAEVHGLASAGGESAYRVELTLRRADRASLPARVVSWLGQRLGLSSPDVPPRLAWSANTPAGDAGIIAVDLRLDGVDDGMHVVELRVADEIGGGTAESRRVVKIVR